MSREEFRAYIALGSNMGDRLAFLGKGILYLSQHPEIEIRKLSSIYETAPQGYLDQDDFYNMVMEVRTSLEPLELLKECLKIEQKLGRERTFKNGPRTIDLDLLFYDELVLHDEMLTLPHPRAHERNFVLVPLVEIAPDLIHPVLRKSMREVLQALDLTGVRKLAI